jgi:dTDP-4-amino-4,6-dideoxygalactose transaminase
LVGATPVFVDIDDFYTIDVDLIESRITSKTRAIIPVHLYGQMCDMKSIMQIASSYNLVVIEDCAQAHLSSFNGVNSGLFGDYGTFSFYPGKNLGAYGDAGGIIVKSKTDYNFCKMFANHGMLDVRHVHHIIGMNSRLDGLQAAVLRVKLNYIKDWTEKRKLIAERYSEGLGDCLGLDIPKVRDSSVHSFHVYAIKTKYRNELANYLVRKGVPTSIHYPYAIPLMPCYSELGYSSTDIPRAFELSQNQLSLPIYPEMPFSDVDEVIFLILNFFDENINNF